MAIVICKIFPVRQIFVNVILFGSAEAKLQVNAGMYGRQVVGGAHKSCKHLARYISSRVCADHALKQTAGTPHKPRETIPPDSKWKTYSEMAFESQKKCSFNGNCSINVINDDLNKETPCVINIYLRSPKKIRKEDDADRQMDKKEFTWDSLLTSKINRVETQTKPFTPRGLMELDTDILRSKLFAIKVKRGEESQTKTYDSRKDECQELYAQEKFLCYNVSLYNYKTTEYQTDYNSKEVISRMIHLAYKQPEASGISRLFKFCRNLLSADVKTNQNNRNETRIDATKKVAKVFRPHCSPTTTVHQLKPISPRTLSDFKVFKTSAQVCKLQCRSFSSKSSSGKEDGKEGNKKKTSSFLDDCINKIFIEIKKTFFGGMKNVRKATSETPSTAQKVEDHPEKTSGEDVCLQKSIARLNQIKSTSDGVKAKKEEKTQKICSRTSPLSVNASTKTQEKGVDPGKKTTKDVCAKDDAKTKVEITTKGEKTEKICSKQSPTQRNVCSKNGPKVKDKSEKTNACKKETVKEKRAEPAKETCKRDPPSKQERPICAKDPQVPICRGETQKSTTQKGTSEKETCTEKIYVRCAGKPMPETAETKSCKTAETKEIKKKPEIYVDRRCIQDGDTPKEELEQYSQKTEDTCKSKQGVESEKREKASCAKKEKKDPCKKYRLMRQQKLGVTKKESCSQEKTHKTKEDSSCKSEVKKVTCLQEVSKSKKDPCSQGGAKKDTPKSDPCFEEVMNSKSKKDHCSQEGVSSKGVSKKESCSQRAKEKNSKSKKDLCSQGGVKKDTPKSDPCFQEVMHPKSKKDHCSQDGVSSKGESKTVSCSQAAANEKKSESKKNPCSQGGAKKDTPGGSVSKKDSCSQRKMNEKSSKSKQDTTCKTVAKKGGDEKGTSKRCVAASSQGIPKKETSECSSGGKKKPTEKVKTKDDCSKFIAPKRESISGVCDLASSKNECEDKKDEYNKCEASDDENQIILDCTRKCLAKSPKSQSRHDCQEYVDEDKRYASVVTAWEPPYDIMDNLGAMLEKTNEHEIDDYYGDSYPNHLYYMYTREFFYDVNAILQVCRQPQPVAPFKRKAPITVKDPCEDN